MLEAMKYGLGFRAANPGLEVFVAVWDAMPTELFRLCPEIGAAFPVDLEPFRDGVPGPDVLPGLPRAMDFVVENNLMEWEVRNRGRDLGWLETRVLNYLAWSRREVRASGRGTLFPGRDLPRGLDYAVDVPVRLAVPDDAERAASPWTRGGGVPRIAVVLGGSSGRAHYPSLASWRELFIAIQARYPRAEIVVTGASNARAGRTRGPHAADEVRRAFSDFRAVAIAYDIGILPQLALLAASDLLIAPHTGFAFLASTVNTPWVAISGGNWPEWFFNRAPFYSVLPDDPDYPHEGQIDHDLADGYIPGMDPETFRDRIPEIVEAIRTVTRADFTYPVALERHRRAVKERVARADRMPLRPGF